MHLTMACTIKEQHLDGSNATSPASMAARQESRLRDIALAQVRVAYFKTMQANRLTQFCSGCVSASPSKGTSFSTDDCFERDCTPESEADGTFIAVLWHDN